jgi:hypothetical protein
MGIMRMVEMMIATRIQIERLTRIQLNFNKINIAKIILIDLCCCDEGHNFSKVQIFNSER